MIKKNLGTSNGGYDNGDDQYPEFLGGVAERFNSAIKDRGYLFTTNVSGLNEAYLGSLPEEARQHYTCNACKHFIKRFGGLVIIKDNGVMESAIWDDKTVPDFFKESVKAMKNLVLKSKVNGVFVPKEKTLGIPKTGVWEHISVELPTRMLYRGSESEYQIMAEKEEDFKVLISALLKYDTNVVNQALALLKTDSMYRSDVCLGVGQWFKDLMDKRDAAKKSENKNNIVWLAVAKAPEGYAHVKNSMIGTLLDDLASGLAYDTVSDRFEKKMETYMRSSSAPTEGGIRQAESVVEEKGIKGSLLRRYPKLEEIPYFIWRSLGLVKKEKTKEGGVFSNITPKNKGITLDTFNLPSTVMTWDKFQKTVLPTAEKIEVLVDNPNRLMAMVTASDETAPNILKWDNLFSWYYHGGVDGEIRRRVERAGGRYENNEIRCSLLWEGTTDLDLHCITPRGNHIYYRRGSRIYDGGYLDVDANGMDGIRKDPVENIRWAGNAPQGRYKFYVHNYNERENRYKGTPFKVELEVNGKVFSYIGEPLRGEGKVDVFSFEYVKGQEPRISGNFISKSQGEWDVPVNSFVEVSGITYSPNLWGENPITSSGSHVFFLLKGCRDKSEGKGRGFFNEMLKSDLREIRKTLEAYTASTSIEGSEEATACGVGYSKDGEWGLTLRVTSENSTRLLKLDRWD